MLKATRRQFYSDVLPTMLSNNPRRFWSVINPHSRPDISLTNSNGDQLDDAPSAQLFNNAFSPVFTHEVITPSPALRSLHDYSMPSIVISDHGILSLLNNREDTTSTDPLGFNYKILKNISQSSFQVLSALLSQSLSSGSIPHDW